MFNTLTLAMTVIYYFGAIHKISISELFVKLFLFIFFLILTLPQASFALPIDWHGVLGVDTTLIDSYRRVEQTQQGTANTGSQELSLANGQHANASFKTYLFRLEPVLIVNDSSSIKMEFSNGYGRGGRLGTNDTTSKSADMANNLYYFNTVSPNSSGLLVNQLYMELYSDAATYQLGRHTANWGLGAVINSGENTWDRNFFVRDGITMKVKIGNFDFAPFISDFGASESLTRATKGSEYGFSALYDNPERDLAFGLYYSKKETSAFNGTVKSDIQATGTQTALGEASTKLTDIYLKKKFGMFQIGVEVPILSGDVGYLYTTQSKTNYKGKALLLEASFDFTDHSKLRVWAGNVAGDSGGQSSFDAMYLNPNYQIANLLFRYNLRAVADPTTYGLFDSYITNAKYAKLSYEYKSDKSKWSFAVLQAVANETAKAGTVSYNHLTNKNFNAQFDQSDSLGTEIDVDFDYQWNNEVILGGSFGYLLTGDYFAYTNTSTPNTTKNAMVMQLRSGIAF